MPLRSAGSRPAFPTVSEPDGRTLGEAEIEALTRVVRSAKLCRTNGHEVDQLEAEFAALIGAGHAVASTSGTAAIHLAVAALDPEPGDEIIVPPISDFGTVAGVLAQNAIPVFADVDPGTGCLTAASVAAAITPRTKAVIVVHLFGGPAPVDEIVQLARARGIAVIEDCAQAYLTLPEGGSGFAGTRGDIGCFSLQQSKHITAGDGGLTVTDDPALARRMKLFADKGWPRDTGERTHLFFGLNYRMTELQAAVARAQLSKLPGVVERRRRTGAAAIAGLSGLPGLRLVASPQSHSFWMFPVVLDRSVIGKDCRVFAAGLAELGVPAVGGYLTTPLHLVPAVADRSPYGRSDFPYSMPPASREIRYRPGDCPVAESMVAETLLVIAWNEGYGTEQVDWVVDAVREVHAGAVPGR